ncbi:MAG: NAD-dependent epimerase/dehydratase family protein [Thermoanaerobaculia bacterium]
MNVLVTGTAGFIGQHVVHTLLECGHEVLRLDIVERPDQKVRTVRCDILDLAKLKMTFSDFKPEAVLHLAARVDLAERNNLAAYAVNMGGVQNVIDAVRSTPTVQRAIYTSTQLVCRVGYEPKGDEDYAPNTLYGESKVIGEKLVRQQDGGGATWCLVRPTTIWGPGMGPHYQRFFNMIRHGRYFHVGRHPLLKSYGYVENTAFQYMRLLEAPAGRIHRKTFYLADYEPLDLRQWAIALQQAMAAPPIPTMPKTLARVAAAAGDVINAVGLRDFPFNSFRLHNILTQYQFDTKELRSICGPLPFTVANGIEKTAEWFLRLERTE